MLFLPDENEEEHEEDCLYGYQQVAVLVCVVEIHFQLCISIPIIMNIRQNIRNTMLAQWRSSSPVYLKNTSTGAFASQFIEEIEANWDRRVRQQSRSSFRQSRKRQGGRRWRGRRR